jgi:4'-phosphopantetheinyl transferase
METCASVRDLAASGKQIGMAAEALACIPLPDPAIKIWLARLDLEAEQVRQCALLLPPDELLRADGNRFERDRRRFIVARATLRKLLGGCLAVAPETITFAYARNGKPFIADRTTELEFNVSHAHERALYAIASRHALGVDIEYLNRDVNHDALAERFFTGREHAQLQRIPEADRKRAFLICWTRKEAVIKATGDGLSLPLDQFEVTTDPDAAPQLLDFAGAAPRAADWNLHAVDVGADYVATVATRRSG